jgi:hypothetical protein
MRLALGLYLRSGFEPQRAIPDRFGVTYTIHAVSLAQLDANIAPVDSQGWPPPTTRLCGLQSIDPALPMTTACYMSHPKAMAGRSRTVAGIILWCLWQAIRIPTYLFLSILAPVVRVVLSVVALLAILTTLLCKRRCLRSTTTL